MSGSVKELVRAEGLVKSFSVHGGPFSTGRPVVRAVDGVDLTINAGEILGLVGESGSGKSTTGRLLIKLLEPERGRVLFDGVDLGTQHGAALRTLRKRFQIIFQDPYGSLNPRMKIGNIVGEPLAIHGIGGSRAERKALTRSLLEDVGLDGAAMERYPHEFSGGQRQRIGIARAVACSPEFIVADEPVSALDPPVQAQIINLMMDLRESLGLAYLFIAHDLRLVEHISDRVAVMYLGRIVEIAPAASLYSEPRHPYTRALLESTPASTPGEPTPPTLQGEQPSPIAPPSGCRFHPRCPVAEKRCERVDPVLSDCGPGRRVACHIVCQPGPDRPGGE